MSTRYGTRILQLCASFILAVSSGTHFAAFAYFGSGQQTLFTFGVLYFIASLLLTVYRKIVLLVGIVFPFIGAMVGIVFFPLSQINLFFLALEFAAISCSTLAIKGRSENLPVGDVTRP